VANFKDKNMNTVVLKTPNVIIAITDFLSIDFLQEEIQTLPNDLQEIFDLVLDTDAGNCLQTRRKMLRIKELATTFAKTLAPFSEYDIQELGKKHQN
jgi:hypothetical protein